MYCVRLTENHKINSFKIQKKIEQLELKTPEKRFPNVKPPESAYEAYFWGTEDECFRFIADQDSDIRDLLTYQLAVKES